VTAGPGCPLAVPFGVLHENGWIDSPGRPQVACPRGLPGGQGGRSDAGRGELLSLGGSPRSSRYSQNSPCPVLRIPVRPSIRRPFMT
jgi:hypothetical protein